MYWYVVYNTPNKLEITCRVIDIHPFEFMKQEGIVVTYMREINEEEYKLAKRLWGINNER